MRKANTLNKNRQTIESLPIQKIEAIFILYLLPFLFRERVV